MGDETATIVVVEGESFLLFFCCCCCADNKEKEKEVDETEQDGEVTDDDEDEEEEDRNPLSLRSVGWSFGGRRCRACLRGSSFSEEGGGGRWLAEVRGAESKFLLSSNALGPSPEKAGM